MRRRRAYVKAESMIVLRKAREEIVNQGGTADSLFVLDRYSVEGFLFCP